MSEHDDTGTLIPFNYGDAQVRVVPLDGEPWFVLADLCRILELPNRSMVARRLADDMKGVTQIDTPGGPSAIPFLRRKLAELEQTLDLEVAS